MAITNGYCTLSDVKAALRISDSTDDSLIEVAIESSSRLIDGYCSRNFNNQGTATRLYVARDPYYVQVDDFQSVITLKTSILVPGTFDVTWNLPGSVPQDVQLEPLNGGWEGSAWSYDRLRATGRYFFPTLSPNFSQQALVQLTAVFGWASVPTVIKQATIIQSMRIYKRLDSPLGVAGFGEFGVMRVSRMLDPDVQMLVEPYRKMNILA